jgi:hypothetical protein
VKVAQPTLSLREIAYKKDSNGTPMIKSVKYCIENYRYLQTKFFCLWLSLLFSIFPPIPYRISFLGFAHLNVKANEKVHMYPAGDLIFEEINPMG